MQLCYARFPLHEFQLWSGQVCTARLQAKTSKRAVKEHEEAKQLKALAAADNKGGCFEVGVNGPFTRFAAGK